MPNVLKNGSFEEPWETLPPVAGALRNQRPAHWGLEWLEPGDHLWGSNDIAMGIPECVHKLATQLPPDEQLGAENALIRDGSVVYKVFHANASFGVRLSQAIMGLHPGTIGIFTCPVQVHAMTRDPWAVEVGVWLNGDTGSWTNLETLGMKEWFTIQESIVVPADGIVEIEIFLKSKWSTPVDFFLDDLRFSGKIGDQPDPPDPPSKVVIDVPANVTTVELRILR